MPVKDRLATLATWWRSRRISEGLPTAAGLLRDIARLKRTIFYLELALLIGLFSLELSSQYREIRAHERDRVHSFVQTAVEKPLALLARMALDERARLEQDDASLSVMKAIPIPAIVHLEDYTAATFSQGNTRLLHVGDRIDADITPSRLFPGLAAMSTPARTDNASSETLSQPRSRWFWRDGVLYHASAAALTRPLAASRFGTGEIGAGAVILMFVRRFDQARLNELTRRFDLPSLTVLKPGQEELNNGVDILDRYGKPIARIAWESQLQGSVHLLEIGLLTAIIILALFGIGQYMSRRIRALGEQIDRIHEVNARDRARLRSLIEASNDGLMVLDRKGKILDINRSITRRSGYSREELIGKFFFDLAPHLPLDDPDFLSGVKTLRSEVSRKDGQTYWLEIGVSALDDDELNGGGRYIIVTRDVTKRVEQEQEIWHKAHYDSLTELPNRSLFMIRLNADLMRAMEANNQCVLMFVDLDGFKLVNDTHGHETGDALLAAVADRFRETVREEIMVSRLGGDEFGIAMPAGTDLQQAEIIAARLTKKLSEPYALDQGSVRISASIGIARGPLDAHTASELMRAADKAMYLAKRHAPGSYQVARTDEPNDGYRALKRLS